MKKAWMTFENWWVSLPHWAQAALTLFGGATVGVLYPAVSAWANSQPVQLCAGATGWVCLKIVVINAIKSGVLAVIGLYLPSPVNNARHLVAYSEVSAMSVTSVPSTQTMPNGNYNSAPAVVPGTQGTSIKVELKK
jgi:hypothetical protein